MTWVSVNWLKNSSKIISFPDYFTRHHEGIQEHYKQRTPTEADVSLCEKYNKKLDQTKIYSMNKVFLLIETLLNLSESDISGIQDQTYALDSEGNPVFKTIPFPSEMLSCGTLIKEESNQCSPKQACPAGPANGVQVVTRSQTKHLSPT